MKFDKFSDWAFKAILSSGVMIGVTSAAGMRASLDELNAKLVVIIEKTARNERDLDKHEERLRVLEIKGGNHGI